MVGIAADIPDDPQMREVEAVVPFENDTMLTINSPIWIEGATKVRPRKAPNVGEHSDEILGAAGYSDADIAEMRASGVVA